MNFIIRESDQTDAALIADISRQTFYESFISYSSRENMDIFLREQFTWEKLVDEVGRQENKFFLAESEGQIAGYVKLRQGNSRLTVPSASLEIARLYALKPWIGKGVGKILMQRSFEYAHMKKSELIWLGVWEKNVRAIEFYKKWGFTKFGETDFILGNEVQRDWLMKKEL